MHRATSAFADAGARLVVIGNGAPTFIAGFRDKSGYDGPLYTDPDLTAFARLGLERSVRSILNLRTLRRAVDAYRDGYRQGRTRGDAWQQGGVFVVARGGAPVYRYPSKFAGDHPPVEEVVAAARRTQESAVG